MMAIRLALLPVLLGASVALAAPTHGYVQEGPDGQTVQVAVRNEANDNVRVYVLQDGRMIPLGLVNGAGSETFAMPPGFSKSEGIQLIADPLDSNDWYKSDRVAIGSASEVDFTIASALHRSSVSVK